MPTRGYRVPRPRRIAFINEKGGSAKTTLVANIASHLVLRRGRRVLAIDMDPQGQLGKVLGVNVRQTRRTAIDLVLDTLLGDPGLDRRSESSGDPTSSLPIVRTHLPSLDVIVANKSLGLFPHWEGADTEDPTSRLDRALESADELASYDFVLFDAAPSFGPLTISVLRAAREIVVPVPLTYLALDGCAELLRTVETVRKRYGNPELRISMVVPTFYRRTRLAKEVLEKLKTRFPKEIAHSVVGYHVKIDEAQSRGLSIFEHAPRDRGAQVMAELAEELELRAPTDDTEPGP
ncbi:MAG: ParA family protein [Deltaproteobacteria bacterium]|nr:ParA family protein [Deltaproteobacteria bacterium]